MNVPEAAKILVFARAPVAGSVKTRLIPRLGAMGAAALHEDLVRHALAQARDAELGDPVLCCAPHTAHPFFSRCAREYGVALWPQCEGGLGGRMHAALARALALAPLALLMGSDCPALDASILRAAAAALASGSGIDLVFVPAEDGGYVLIGARRIDEAVFDGIEWGSADVMRQTRERVRALGWISRELPALWDVDRPQDLARLTGLGIAVPAASGVA